MEEIVLLPEWEKQNFVQLVFPHENSDWNCCLDEAIDTFVQIAKNIAKYQKVVIVAFKIKKIKSLFINKKNIFFVGNIESNDTWSRDFGAISIKQNNKIKLLNFNFNGWGKKYPYKKDNDITFKLKLKGVFKGYIDQNIDFVLEGGSIDNNGSSILLTTTKCLLEKNRNPRFKKAQIELKLKKYFGLKKILWLNSGALKGDDTDSHIDTLARFVSKDTIVYQTAYKNSVNYDELKKMEQELKKFKDLNNKSFILIPLPPIEDILYDGEILPATYANFLIINGAVLVPIYGDKNDKKTINLFKKLFPTRDIVEIDCKVLLRQHGSLHCVTMQYY